MPSWNYKDSALHWNLPENPPNNTTLFVVGIEEEHLTIHLHQAALKHQKITFEKQEKTHYYAFIHYKRGSKTKLSTSVKV
jgi:hypothetical protein